jgi:hypothetical protein
MLYSVRNPAGCGRETHLSMDQEPPGGPPPPNLPVRSPRKPPHWMDGRKLDQRSILLTVFFVVAQIGACWLWGFLTSG